MAFEIEFLPVGNSNGDAILFRHGSDAHGWTIHVIDGGYSETGEKIIEHLNTYYGAPLFIDHVVLTHADNDHAVGLKKVMEHFAVGTLWMNRPWLYAAETVHHFHGNYSVEGLRAEMRSRHGTLVELENIASKNGTVVREAFAGNQIGLFRVLAPTKERYLSLIPYLDRTPTNYLSGKGLADIFIEGAKKLVRFIENWWDEQLSEHPDPTSASNESCIVQMAIVDGQRILLTADAGPLALHEAADVAAYLGLPGTPNVIQIPHHGSRRNVTPSVLNRWLGPPVAPGTIRGGAYCSVGHGKPQYPRKRVKNAFLRRGYEVYSTRDRWIRHRNDMPPRPGAVPVTSEDFETDYEE